MEPYIVKLRNEAIVSGVDADVELAERVVVALPSGTK